ncbi:MAG TPA: protein kinase [Kofleriaceae bacterium]
MTAQRWQLIETLFECALELPEPERDAFLGDRCGGDPELREEVRELLATALHPSGSLREAVIAEAQALASAATAQVGRRIGPFRLLALLGEGGMGAVYLADRDDAQFHHRVAIKILPHSLGSPHAIARFRDERQILAALEHPNIVRLLDGGSTEDGLPYLVMEHIEGTTITHYARDNQLSVRARLALVRQVCAGLQYAHQNLVVHRDVKPSNILVDADGTAKILDFGIAKLLAPDAGFEREARTRTGSAMFTPEYASPEQARGDAVSTATDVYSLGAVLYELVTGQPPHRTSGSALESLRLICEIDPPRPSAAAPPERRRELTGDLDNIILKALHKESARRYAAVEQLSDDLGRFLEGRPVVARTATVGYRARKFVHRNKVVVAAAMLVIATLSGATVISLEQAARAEIEKVNALDAARRAQIETDHARRAEAQVKTQLEQIKTEQSARALAEAEARAKGDEVELSREQLQVALTKAKDEKRLAEQESARAREAEARAEAATRAETAARKEAEALVQKERARVRQLEEQSKKITNELR